MKQTIRLFLIIQFIFYLQFIVFFLRPFGIESESELGKNLSTLINIFFYGFDIIVCILNWSITVSIIRSAKLLIWILIISLVSLLWSNMPDNSLIRLLNLTLQVVQSLSVIVLCLRCKFDMVQLFREATFIVITLNALFYLLLPDLALSKALGEQGRYDALLPSPNNLAQLALLGITFWMPGRFRDIKLTTVYVFSASFLCLFISGSATGMASTVFLIAIVISLSIKQRYISIGIILALYLSIIAWLINPFGNDDQTFKLVNRDTTLTGRTLIWDFLIKEQAKDHREYLGYGVGGFWDPTSKRIHVDDFLDRFMQSHNGYLETYLQLGVIGIILLVILVSKTVKLISRTIRRPECINMCLALIIILINNLTESSLLSPKHPNWLVFTISYSLMAILNSSTRMPLNTTQLVINDSVLVQP